MDMIGIVGQGFVGNAVATVMKQFLSVAVYDKSALVLERIASHPNVHKFDNLPAMMAQTKMIFVCVPTPMFMDTGACDTSIVESVLDDIAELSKGHVAVVKSTVPPGSTERWNAKYSKRLSVVFNPEFLTEANAVEDFRNQNRIIVGGPRPATTKVKQVYETAFPKVPIIKTSSTIAETVKYVTNTFLATKVSYANEIYQLCERLDIDYDKVIEYARYDERLGKSHWSVPGPMLEDLSEEDKAAGKIPRKMFGFAGSCFIKDLNAIIHLAKELGITPTMLEATWKKNLEVRPERDWENLMGRAVSGTTKKLQG